MFYLFRTISLKVLWGGRWQVGSACSTGEEVEQINSYMSRCGNTTKYMLPEGTSTFSIMSIYTAFLLAAST